MKKVLMILVIMLSFITFMPKVYALDCNNGSCYCDESGENCAIMRNPRGEYTVLSSGSKCGCDGGNSMCIKTSEIWQFVGYGLFAIKIIIPLVIMIFGMIDFTKAVMSGDDKTIKSAGASLIKRLVLCACIFFIPSVISLIFKLVDNTSTFVQGAAPCEECLTDPTGETCKSYVNQAEQARKNGAN